MINFEEELKKFHPSLEVEDAEEAIYNQDLTDAADLLVKMMKEAEKNKEADAKKKELADAKNEAEQIINMTEKAIKDLGDKVTDSDKKEAEELIEKTKKAMEGEDAKEITEAKDKLLEKANALATKVYESTAKEGQENTTTEEAPKEDKKDDVVDAEFEEK